MKHTLLCLVLAASLAMSVGGCRKSVPHPPTEGRYTGDKRDWITWGSGGGCIYATTSTYVHGKGDQGLSKFLVYAWEDGDIATTREIEISKHDDFHNVVPASGGRIVFDYSVCNPPKTKVLKADIVLRDMKEDKDLQRWPVPLGWMVSDLCPSHNGRYVAVEMEEDYSAPDFSWDRFRTRVGLVDAEAMTLVWAGDVVGPEHCRGATCVVPSDDGAYVAIAGFDNIAVMVDAKNKKVLWRKGGPPDYEVWPEQCAIAPDNSTAYFGGFEGILVGIDVKSGKIVSRWWATLSGGKERCDGMNRIVSVQVSPDGKYVAAATIPKGMVYIWDRATGQRAKVHRAGSIMTMMFSPDSRHIAAMAPGWVSVTTVLPKK